MVNLLRKSLNSKKSTLCTRVYSRWTYITELVGMTGNYDYIEFLAECAPVTQEEMEHICLVAERYSMGSLIKVDKENRGYVMQKAVAAGFNGILLTDHKTADEVWESIRCVRPDSGEGGLLGRPGRRFAMKDGKALGTRDYRKMLNDIVIAVMIEKKAAVENLEAILSVPGVDMVQWGPNDYAMNMGWEQAERSEDLKQIEQYIISQCLAHGISPRCEIKTAEQGVYYRDLGVRHFCLGDEISNNLAFWDEQGKRLLDYLK